VIITAIPINRRLPEIEFQSAREFERALGNNDPQDYRDFTCERATPEESVFCALVPFDWQDPEGWFAAAARYTDPNREIDGVPAPVILLGLEESGRRFDSVADFEDGMGDIVALTQEGAYLAANEAAMHEESEALAHYFDVPAMVAYLEDLDWQEVGVPRRRIHDIYVDRVVCHADALAKLTSISDDAGAELIREKGKSPFDARRLDDEDCYYFGDMETFVEACIAKERRGKHTPFNASTQEWFDEERYFDDTMTDYTRVEYDNEPYYIYFG
jgi:hypothetical protein